MFIKDRERRGRGILDRIEESVRLARGCRGKLGFVDAGNFQDGIQITKVLTASCRCLEPDVRLSAGDISIQGPFLRCAARYVFSFTSLKTQYQTFRHGVCFQTAFIEMLTDKYRSHYLSTKTISGVYIPSALLILGVAIIKKEWLPYAAVFASLAGGYKIYTSGASMLAQRDPLEKMLMLCRLSSSLEA